VFSQKAKNDKFVDVRAMDVTKLTFSENSFDLVISNLVLWAVGPKSSEVCKEVHRVLKPKGVFYSFEPDDQTLIFYPDKPAITKLMDLWDQKLCTSGTDPFIGRKVHECLLVSGFKDIETKVFSKVSTGVHSEKYKATSQNLKNLYMDASAEKLGLRSEKTLWKEAEVQFDSFGPNDLILESYFVNLAIKSNL
jgi:ubiquinone/menaquinone biosynthesis C-methylase UbiE